MARMSDHHKTLNEQGEGKCSMPMWSGGGVPAGFCNKPAYGTQLPSKRYRDAIKRCDGYAPALACPRHGGPEFRTFMDGDKWCAVMPDFEDLQVSPTGFGDTREEAIEELKKDKSIAMPRMTAFPAFPALTALRAERDELCAKIRQLCQGIEMGIPEPPDHVCGNPDSMCDGLCVDWSNWCQFIAECKKLSSPKRQGE